MTYIVRNRHDEHWTGFGLGHGVVDTWVHYRRGDQVWAMITADGAEPAIPPVWVLAPDILDACPPA